MVPSLYDIFVMYVIYDICQITYDKNTICQYGCRKFRLDLYNSTPRSKLSKCPFHHINQKCKDPSFFSWCPPGSSFLMVSLVHYWRFSSSCLSFLFRILEKKKKVKTGQNSIFEYVTYSSSSAKANSTNATR